MWSEDYFEYQCFIFVRTAVAQKHKIFLNRHVLFITVKKTIHSKLVLVGSQASYSYCFALCVIFSNKIWLFQKIFIPISKITDSPAGKRLKALCGCSLRGSHFHSIQRDLQGHGVKSCSFFTSSHILYTFDFLFGSKETENNCCAVYYGRGMDIFL